MSPPGIGPAAGCTVGDVSGRANRAQRGRSIGKGNFALLDRQRVAFADDSSRAVRRVVTAQGERFLCSERGSLQVEGQNRASSKKSL